jgi:lipopolysaccharide/colanic/teichoic acid biosynthesis glycosyltransferase
LPAANPLVPLEPDFQPEAIELDPSSPFAHHATKCNFGEGHKYLKIELAIKRAFDIVFSFLLIILLSPMLLLAAVCVRLSSRGPALFKQERWGWRERKFVCFKFRSMRVNQVGLIDPQTLSKATQSGVLIKHANDPRVTKVGAFLRKTSIDELPQLFNVLKGDMSFVGPRPLVLHMLDVYPELRKVRSQVRPGITCIWQISARHQNTSALLMKSYDLEYIANFSLWLDLKILLRTPAAVLFTGSAY